MTKQAFTLLKGSLPERLARKQHRRDVELDAMARMIYRFSDTIRPIEEISYFERMKAAYAVIKLTAASSPESSKREYDTVLSSLNLVEVLLQDLPADEFMRWFPPNKTFDGARYGVKDYFTTMEVVRKYPTITEQIEFLMEYDNNTVRSFMVNAMMAMDRWCQAQGKEAPMDRFFREAGITSYHMTELPNGKRLLTGSDGSQRIFKKAMPRHLRVVKGGVRH